MSNLYICVDCEVNSSITDPTSLNAHGLCLRCGSSSVVAVDVLKSLIQKRASLENVVRETSPTDTSARWQAIRDQRKRDNSPLIDYLFKIDYLPLQEVLTQWDGWAWNVHYPWEADVFGDPNPEPGAFTIELVQGTKDGPRWLVVLDTDVVEVRPFPYGTK